MGQSEGRGSSKQHETDNTTTLNNSDTYIRQFRLKTRLPKTRRGDGGTAPGAGRACSGEVLPSATPHAITTSFLFVLTFSSKQIINKTQTYKRNKQYNQNKQQGPAERHGRHLAGRRRPRRPARGRAAWPPDRERGARELGYTESYTSDTVLSYTSDIMHYPILSYTILY